MNNEIRYIPGCNNAYGCDKEGNIYSYYIRGAKGKLGTTPQKMALFSGGNNDYLMIKLSLGEEKSKTYMVHRLIAQTFIPNLNNLPEINHIDHNPQNNRVDNLEWCDHKYNMEHANTDLVTLNGLATGCQLIDPAGEVVEVFKSISAACRYASEKCGCSKTGLQKYKKSNGYTLIVAKNEKREKKVGKCFSGTKCDLFDPNDEIIGTFNSFKEAGEYINNNIRPISVKRFADAKKVYGYYAIAVE